MYKFRSISEISDMLFSVAVAGKQDRNVIFTEPGDLIIEDQTFREHFFMYKFRSISEISDMLFSVAVAGKQDRNVIFTAAAKDFTVIIPGIAAVAVRGKGGFVDLKDNVVIFGCFGGSECYIYGSSEGFHGYYPGYRRGSRKGQGRLR